MKYIHQKVSFIGIDIGSGWEKEKNSIVFFKKIMVNILNIYLLFKTRGEITKNSPT